MPDKKPICIATDEALLCKLARLAKIRSESQEFFLSQIALAIEAAHEEQDVKQLRQTPDQITPLLGSIAKDAKKLCEQLKRLSPRGSESGPQIAAGKLLRAIMIDYDLNIGTCVGQLNKLAAVADAASTKARAGKGRPTGTAGYANFDFFVRRLLLATKHSGGKLTIYKSEYVSNGWDGTLLKAVKLLRSSLPNCFLPKTLASSLDRIMIQFRAETRKNHR
jgi:hypothetical protein